jgi:hypothetical protein
MCIEKLERGGVLSREFRKTILPKKEKNEKGVSNEKNYKTFDSNVYRSAHTAWYWLYPGFCR